MIRKYFFGLVLLLSVPVSQARAESLLSLIDHNLSFAIKQDSLMAITMLHYPGRLPQTINRQGNLVTCSPTWWVSGFFPGSLWYLYEYSKDKHLESYAQTFTQRVASQQYNTDTHDVGFMINCSFGNGYRITGNPAYKQVLENAAHSLSTRFNPVVGCIRSWNGTQWEYPVIIDNMMNLELLFNVAHLSGDKRYGQIAVSHANKTLENQFRPNGSCFHLVSYDTITGRAVAHKTVQGYSDSSSWARGQAWALYAYTMCYRETGDMAYLHQAEKVASFLLNNPHLPKDKIPYWDFDDPAIPHTYRDASAGAVICSALIELSQYVPREKAKEYLQVAATQIRTLSSPAFRAKLGGNGDFILMHSVGNLPGHTEIDVPLTYADYYYIEALTRYRNLLLGKPLFPRK
ncbi:glycoside hydrolase family 88 protein [Microbacter margulisiae]|uniref:Rhamnogalacturonyl hydrolase YesR n=1 Tax=Microbacter margulisiae TaxID=1350067 RepID=A0A7W5H245_9PORP|nr:glycoside hydrolase family 88 protein [Microbacter margulisiae]MBB3188298.1 rhamnogalacturonyl hydrolase YesR [Microbacter margulisiae]